MTAETHANYATSAIAAVAAEIGQNLDPQLTALYALLAVTKGAETTMRDVHDAWAIWRQYTNPTHRSLIPYDQLSFDVQELDRPYLEAIHRAAEKLPHD